MTDLMNEPPRIARRSLSPLPWQLDELPPVLQRIYAGRGVLTTSELDHQAKQLLSPDALGHVDRAAHLLAEALAGQWAVAIVADFDADGATACAVMVRGLRLLGFETVHYFVPRREAGYGLTRALVDQAHEVGAKLLITVDNGVTAIEAVQYANDLGLTVLITDHHLPGPQLPAAAAIVNPNLRGENFPSKALCGVGVAFYVLMGLRRWLREQGAYDQQPEPNLGSLLDFVALGTVADVVAFDHNNRILVAEGLKRMREGKAHCGINALAKVAGRSLQKLSARDLGFLLGPRLNAAGRLADMRVGIACLLSDDDAEAEQLAAQLNGINETRRQKQTEMVEQAEARLKALNLQGALPPGLCLFDEQWNQGLVGLLASRLKDRYQRPTFVFCRDSATTLRASGRTPEGLHLRDTLALIHQQLPDALVQFGGHSAAAGLTLREAYFEAFKECFAAVVSAHCPQGFRRIFLTDGELAPDEFSWRTVRALESAGPWGKDFEEPLFDGVFSLKMEKMGKKQHIRYRLTTPHYPPLDAISFGLPPMPTDRPVRVVYQLERNEWRGESKLQLRIEHWELTDVSP